MGNYYVLDGKTPRPVDSAVEWANAFERDSRIVAKSKLPGDVRVSTVFLGLDHSWDGGPPLLFETMIFGGAHNDYQERYSTWEEAEKGHAEAVALANTPATDAGGEG